MTPLGAGLVFWPALAPLFESGDAAVLELEPQTLWKKTATSSSFAYQINETLFESIAAFGQPKLVHGVGQPIGGTVDDPLDYVPLLARTVSRLRPAWTSEHLSFNRVRHGNAVVECGFLLPPSQTPASVRVAAANIRRYSAALGCPFAFETGVNYLEPDAGELDDGAFFAAVAKEADCGILLDLHNLWCNDRNGRQTVRDALAQLPLERVWEIHFAGGSVLDGMRLDAHSHASPPELIDLAAELMPRMPNVGALIFEILPEHLPRLGLDGVHRQLEAMHGLWQLRPATRASVPANGGYNAAPTAADFDEVRAWEQRLVKALRGEAPTDPLSVSRGCRLFRRLVRDARSASLARGLRFTVTALLASVGPRVTERLLVDYCRETNPDAFVALECHQFAAFLATRDGLLSSVPYLDQVLAFERALVLASAFGESSEVQWSVEPTALLDALESGRLPRNLPHSPSRMHISTQPAPETAMPA